jgi:ABC-type Fe3+ transport system substrate-binding protein
MKGFNRLLFQLIAVLGALGLSALCATAAEPKNPKLAAMIKKAAQEAEITYQGPDPTSGLPTQDMLREMAAITKKYFGVDIRVKIDNALSYPASTAKTLAEIKSGAVPSFDLMYQTELSAAPLYTEKAIEPVPWLDLFSHLTAKDLEYNGLALIRSNYVLQPEYNTTLVKAPDVPKNWEDILDSKWKGKLGMPIYPDPWMIFSQPNAWGEEKTFDYLEKLMRLNPKLGRYPEVHERVLSGETVLAWLGERERALFAKERRGVPVSPADRVEPVLLQTNILFLPKRARNSNAATLLAAAMLTQEGQELEIKYRNLSSMFRPNTPAAEFASRRKFVKTDVDFILKKGPELSKKITAIIIKK